MKPIEITVPKPHGAQLEILNEAKRFNVLCCGRRWGKSILTVRIMIKAVAGGAPVGYFCPTYKLLEGTFKECITRLEPLIKKKHDNQFIELLNGGVIEFWSLDNPQAGRSRKYKIAIIDEAAFVKDLWEAWTQAIRPTLTDLKGSAWFLSTPKGKNDFYKLYSKGLNDDKEWNSWQRTTYTNPYIDKDEIDAAKNDLPEIAFRQEYLAEFSDDIANPFGYEFIKQSICPLSKNPVVCYGIDLAKSFDYTVIVGLDKNGQVAYFDRFQKDWAQTKETIIRTVKDKPAYIDSTGVGDAVTEDIQRQCRKVEGFKFSQTSKQQLMEGLVVGIQQKNVFIIEGVMQNEMESFEYQYGRTGVKYSAPTGMHDDTVCALALAFAKLQTSKTSGLWVV